MGYEAAAHCILIKKNPKQLFCAVVTLKLFKYYLYFSSKLIFQKTLKIYTLKTKINAFSAQDQLLRYSAMIFHYYISFKPRFVLDAK